LIPDFDLNGAELLAERSIKRGENWVYSAGFNVKPDLKNTERIDEELEDLRYLTKHGARVALLSHQGSYKKGNAQHLDFVAPYLQEKLNTSVKYFPSNNEVEVLDFLETLREGEVGIIANTRFQKGEEENSGDLARTFSKFGEYVAVGGFCKAHRKHASNVGILNFLPGFLTSGALKQMRALRPWAGKKPEIYSVAALGGVKKEKITIGLVGFANNYDYIIPGGIVLNSLLKVLGHEVGGSIIEDGGKSYLDCIESVLKSSSSKIYIPSMVTIAEPADLGYRNTERISISAGAPKTHMIVDFDVDSDLQNVLDNLKERGGRMILAGTPTLFADGFTEGTSPLIQAMSDGSVKSIILGGDSVAEIPFTGTTSSGGGAALEFLCRGTTETVEYLKRQTKKKKSEKTKL